MFIYHCERQFILFFRQNLGRGNFGIVYKVEREKKEDFFAMKVMVLGKAGSVDYAQNIKTMNSELQIGMDLGS
jgi:hypothetical protein